MSSPIRLTSHIGGSDEHEQGSTVTLDANPWLADEDLAFHIQLLEIPKTLQFRRRKNERGDLNEYLRG